MKRLIICCDGTWNNPESSAVSNVVKIARAVKPVAGDGIQQVVFYDRGVGTGNELDKIVGGSLGEGIDRNIQDAYRFLVHNYAAGDEIYFFGFSRGAYTARSCIGLIRNTWLVKKENSHLIPKAYHIYRTHWGADKENAREFREPHCQPVNIRFLGVWDTVGALGIPLDLFQRINIERYNFHDTSLSRIVENAYHALAIDEKRKPFAPTIWKTRHNRTHTEQAWFSGVHSDIGGGYHEAGLSNISLKWIADRAAACGVQFDQEYLNRLYGDDRQVLHDTYRGPYRVLGKHFRPIAVTNHDETLHVSAEQRYLANPFYRPKNLKEYLSRDEQIQLPL